MTSMNIAVIGSGISGLSAAWLLSAQHKVTLFEADHRLGGHTNTVDVTLDGVTHAVDTGFLVFNDRTYPNLIQLFELLGVRSAASDMSFSFRMENTGMEWAGTSLASVFAQKRNLLRPHFLRMVKDIVRFNRATTELMKVEQAISGTLEQYLDQQNYSDAFRNWYLVPMAAAIWSSPMQQIMAFPLKTFLRFCFNHGLLQVNDRPQWRTVIGGGREYVKRMAQTINDIRLNTPVKNVQRHKHHIEVHTETATEKFDHVILATHSDQSLALLADADADEKSILGAIKYQPNQAILHTDPSFLPRRKIAHAAWNFHAGYGEHRERPVAVTYLINKLQPLPFSQPVMVTLNPHREPNAENIIQRLEYSHPLFDEAAIKAQKKIETIQGRGNTWHCGAWTRYGFHEDGLMSGLRVASFFGAVSAWQQTVK
jgi:uncharacterized protein